MRTQVSMSRSLVFIFTISLLTLGVLGNLSYGTTDQPQIYWTDLEIGKIQRANLNGSNVQDVITMGPISIGPYGIALDVADGKVYWGDWIWGISRADLDGSNVEEEVITDIDLVTPEDMALDVAGGKIYWTDWLSSPPRIQRANLDGSNIEDIVTTGLKWPDSIALDVANGKVYWTDLLTGKIQRANLDGSNVQDIATTGRVPAGGGIALDIAGGKMYWVDVTSSTIWRANLNGSNVQKVVTTSPDDPGDIALDVAGGKIYWTYTEFDDDTDTYTNGKIQRANLDGSNVQDIVTGLEGPQRLALSIPSQRTPPVAHTETSDPQSGEKGQIVLSEIMFESTGGLRSLPQWFEVFNTTDTEINVRGWQLAWYRRKPSVLDVTVHIQEDFIIPAKQSRLIVSRSARNSGDVLQNNAVYQLFSHHATELQQEAGETQNRLIWREGFYLKLLDAENTLIDHIGTLTDKGGKPTWKLPECLIDGERSSLIRRFDKDVPRPGTERRGWIRAYDTKHQPKGMWYGRSTDIGTPGYRSESEPLPVQLSLFSARVIDGKVVINWITESELNNAGFNILRSQTKQGQFVQVNPKLIQGAGTISQRSTYTWTDTTANPNIVYYYRIEDVSFAGAKQVVANARVRGIFSVKNKSMTQWGQLKAQ